MDLYVSDLDGTLLKNNATISSFTTHYLNKLLENNLLFTIATARDFLSVKEILCDVNLTIPVITLNGGMIVDLKNEKKILLQPLTHDFIEIIVNFSYKNKLFSFYSTAYYWPNRIIFYIDHKTKDSPQIWNCLESGMQLSESLKCYRKMIEVKSRDFICQYNDITHASIIIPIESAKYYKNTLIKEFHTNNLKLPHIYIFPDHHYPKWAWLTFYPYNATKSNAIFYLRNHINKNHLASGQCLERTIAFGDEKNDLDMMEKADVSIAPLNAIEEIKSVSKEKCLSNEDDGVVKYILEKIKIVN